jgi:hypothetical protein
MRHSNHSFRGHGRLSVWAAGLFAIAVAACGGGNGSPPPSVVATPPPTPDPHLHEPVTADQVYSILVGAKVQMNCPNANLGNGNPKIVKQINCNVGGWPLRITQYKSSAILTSTLGWKAGDAPIGDEAPYNWAGLNVLIQFGPISARAPSAPESSRQETAASIVAILDPLLWPIAQHAVTQLPGRTPEPTAAPSVSAAPSKAPSKAPKTPKPSAKP